MLEPRWKRTAYWRHLPRWKQALLEVGNEEAFLLRYFGESNGGRLEPLKDFHLRLVDSTLNKSRALILYPAGHGKTTLASRYLPILEICRWPDIRIVLIAKNDQSAEQTSRFIHAEFEDNQLLIRDFGPFKPLAESNRAWSLDQMVVARRTANLATPTLMIVGRGTSTVLGTRADLCVVDDVVDGKNSASPTQRAGIKDWFETSVETVPEHDDSRLVVVGTRFDPHDLYGDINELAEQDGQVWHVQREDAIADAENHLTLWPERWPWKRLMLKKWSIGVLSFNKRYRNIAVDASRMVVKEQFITGGYWDGHDYPGCIDRNYKIGDFADEWRIVAGFDPAAGGTRNAKFCAHMVVGQASCKLHERCLWVIDIERGQMTLPQQVELILAKHEKYGCAKSIVEANSYQVGLYQAVLLKMEERGIVYTVEPHYTTRTNKPDPELGVQAMAPWFEKGAVHIPWGDGLSQRRMRDFVDELVQFPDGRTSDTVMAFWFAWLNLQLQGPRYESFNRLETTTTAWGKRPRFGTRVVQNPYFAKKKVA